MRPSTACTWMLMAAVFVAASGLGCGSDKNQSAGGGGGGGGDPAREQVLALERVASSVEADVQAGGAELEALADLLEQRLTPEDVSILARNYLAMLESYRTQSSWEPDEDFYALVDRLRDLPFLAEMPGRPGEPEVAEEGLAVQASAIILANATPACGFSCEAQGALYALLDYGAGEIKAYCMDLLFSGVDCMQDAAKMGQCTASQTCTWGDFTLFVAGCASLSANVALELSGASKVKAAYVLLKKVMAIWSVGALASSFADWVAGCHDYQASACLATPCAQDERTCLAATGAGATCCPQQGPCAACAQCQVPCGDGGCCASGQRCDAGQCTTCASSCGPTCCSAKEICANPEIGQCAPCDNPCGLTCCPPEATCLEAMRECCMAPCGGTCCVEGEICLGAPASCCERPCGDRCCAAGQVCDPASMTCGTPGSCADAPPIDCPSVCAEAMEQALARCTAMGGTLRSTDLSGCITNCRCLLTAVPGLSACMLDPTCPGCDELEAAMEGCAQSQVLCDVPTG